MKYKKSLRADGYLNDFHKKSSQASEEAVKSMQERPLSKKVKQDQIARHKRQRNLE